ncbi:hypothetical protein BCR39DRAFT_528588 [Naematelia encephala]|uniref:Polynucleotide 5'-hydroxyl-kinase GRC3 n=1 Tax=Naematelia encephala TaxID=71784 RepID=A0A1Y2B6S3_9TREE|nr:hypothetical protein BCR39DRAFT_528588 [Naematelia encephala]
MSALAARRAAAAAESLTTRQVTIDSSLKKTIAPPSPTQSALIFDVDSDTSSQASTSTVLSSKRRRIDKSPPKKVRYFAQPSTNDEDEPHRETARKARTRKAFSPSAPASDSGLDNDSSDDELLGGGLDVDRDAELELSAASTPGPSRTRFATELTTGVPTTSRFEPKWGVNLHKVSAFDLSNMGIHETPTSTGGGVVVSLSSNENLMLAGMFSLTPLRGSLDLLSSTLHASTPTAPRSYPVFAPTSHPLPVICPSKNSVTSSDLHELPLPSTFALGDDTSDLRTVFLVREHHCGLEELRHGAVPGFSHIWLDHSGAWGLKGVHPVIGSFPTPVYPHITSPSWQSALDSLKSDEASEEAINDEPVVVLVKGPKRSGKSTLARASVNRLLEQYERVAWLECDLGQGEFGCGGVVGLWTIDQPVLGPPFTHPLSPQRAHYLGTYTPLTCPDEYIAAVRHILEHHRYEVQYPLNPTTSETGKRTDIVPLVVNTQGWVKGLGEELLVAIEDMAKPTHVFAFTQPPLDEANYMGNGAGWTSSPIFTSTALPSYADRDQSKVQMFSVDPAPISSLQARHTAADLRILSMISYFHARLSPSVPTTWDISKPILAMRPWQVDLGGAISGVYLSGEGSDGIIPDDLHLALNGAVVALIEYVDNDSYSPPVYIQGRPLPLPEESNFLGLALIRAVRLSTSSYRTKSTISLLSPLSPSVLMTANGMIKNGAIELPLCGMLDWKSSGEMAAGLAGVNWDEVPFLDVGMAGGVGVEKRRFRRNLMRKGM